jgi:hypothetical protein
MGKKSGSGSGMNNPDHISESLETIFGVKYFKSLKGIRDGKNSDPGSAMEKIRIRDPESPILLIYLLYCTTGTKLATYLFQWPQNV